MAKLTALPSVELAVIDEATIYLLKTILALAADTPWLDELVITSGSDGAHSGPDDPHHRGHAFDLRTHNFPSRALKFTFCDTLTQRLGRQFYAFVEDPDQPNEHIHVQVAKGKTYPPAPITVGAARTA